MIKLNEYFIYGILLPYDWYQDWEMKTGRNFNSVFADYIDDNVDADDMICLFDNRDGKFLIIGKVLKRINDGNPIIIPEIDDVNIYVIESIIRRKFKIDSGDFHYYFVKKYK